MPMALSGAAGIWTAALSHCWALQTDAEMIAAGVRTHIETMCSNFKDMARRGAALRIQCATPLRLATIKVPL